jgi:hypothetical protein
MDRISENTEKHHSSTETLERYLPQSEFIEHYIQKAEDPRAKTAKRFYDDVQSGVIKLHKTTRAGATVSICSESVRRNELFTLACRTNRNITKTVKEETANVVGQPVNVIHVLRNSFCPRITEQIKKCPSIEKLGFIPLPNCDSCETAPCPIREAYETPIEKIDGFSLTYAKLQSLIMSESEKVKGLLEKLSSLSRNIIFDEAQTLQEGTTVSVSVWETKYGYGYTFDLRPYNKLKKASPVMQKFLDKVNEIIDSVQPEIEKLKNESAIDHYLKHLASTVQNPAYTRTMEKRKKLQEEEQAERKKLQTERERLQKLHPDQSPFEIMMMIPERITPEIHKAMDEFMREDMPFNEIVKIQEVLIQAIQKPKEYELTEDQIITLSKLLLIVNSDFFTVSYVRGLDGEQISIQAQDTLLYKAIQTFIPRAMQSAMEKRVIFTTATFGSLNIEKLLNIPDARDYIWGDPMNTSSKLLVIVDKSRISPYNFSKKLKDVEALIKAVIEKYGQENVSVCTMNKQWSKLLGVESTWYQSDETEGVSSRKRIWIFVGLAEKPVNAKDHLAIMQAPYHDNPLNLQGKEFLHYVSQKLRVDSVNINTYQAISRAKDPEARNRSVAIMIGAREDEVEKCLLWGPTRTLKPQKTEKGLKFDIEINDPIGKPLLTVSPLSTDVEESLHVIDQWITYGQVVSYKLNWVYLKKLVDARGYVSAKRLVKVNGLDEKEVRQFFDGLPEFFERQGISGYVLPRDSQGTIKAVATTLSYEKLGKPSILYSNHFSQLSIEQATADWFVALFAAVDRAPKEVGVISPRYIGHHVSANVYPHLSEFLDILQSAPNLCPGWLVVGAKGGKRERRQLIRDLHCLGAWSPSFPRRYSKTQFWANDINELSHYASSQASKNDFFLSVYAFPNQEHPSEGGNPPIDTLFMDFDVENERFSELRKAWEIGDITILPELLALRTNLLNEVLQQARTLVDYLVKRGIQPRILLSGFKGVHVFVDFPAVQFCSVAMAKQMLSKLTEQLKAETSVAFDPMVIGDVSRLCRIPNTLHFDASKLLERSQFAVPVTVGVLMSLTAEGYDQLCSVPRPIPISRKESNEVLAMLTRIEQDMNLDEVAVTQMSSVKNSDRLEAYERECTREILADDDFDELDIRPCFKKVHREKISLHGGSGHKMRIGAVMELAMQGLSIPSIVRWFSFCDDYDPTVTEKAIIDLISRGYTDKHMDEYGSEHRKGLRCETIQKCGFCLKDACPIYQKKFGRR